VGLLYCSLFLGLALGEAGHAVAQLVKALRYKPEGRGFDPRSLGIFSGASDGSMCQGVDSTSKNEYQDIPGGKDGRCIRVTTLPPSCAKRLEILEP